MGVEYTNRPQQYSKTGIFRLRCPYLISTLNSNRLNPVIVQYARRVTLRGELGSFGDRRYEAPYSSVQCRRISDSSLTVIETDTMDEVMVTVTILEEIGMNYGPLQVSGVSEKRRICCSTESSGGCPGSPARMVGMFTKACWTSL